MVVFGWTLMGGAIGIAAVLLSRRRERNDALAAPLVGVIGAIIGGVAGGTPPIAAAGAVALVAIFSVFAARSSAVPRLR